MSTMKIAVERFTYEFADEILPLGQECWDECSEIKKDTCAFHGERGLQIAPDFDRYVSLSDQGLLVAMTLRDEESNLRGYALMIFYNSLHLKYIHCGNVDTFYVQKKYRRSMPRFMTAIENEFQSRDVSIVGWPVTRSGLLFKILKKRGYIADDVVMELKLKSLPKGAICV